MSIKSKKPEIPSSDEQLLKNVSKEELKQQREEKLKQKKRLSYLESRHLQNKGEIYLLFMLVTIILFLFLYLIGMVLRDVLYDIMVQSVKLNINTLMETMILFAIYYLFWDTLVMIALLLILTSVIAKIMKLQVWKTALMSFISIILAIITFHIIMYCWFVYSDPLNVENRSLLTILLQYFMDQEDFVLDLNSLTSLLESVSNIGNLLLLLYDKMVFSENPSFMNYLLLYLIGKALANNRPFIQNDFPFNPFNYEIWLELIIYIIIFTILFFLFIERCTCANLKMLEDIEQLDKENYQKEDKYLSVYKEGEGVTISGKSKDDLNI